MQQRHFVFFFISLVVGSLNLANAGPVEVTRSYKARGSFGSFDTSTNEATISHEEIPGYMGAMTMSFPVANAAELRDISPGDTITFQLCLQGQRVWIEQIQRENIPARNLMVSEKAKTAEFQTGDRLPDIRLIDANGRAYWLHDLHGFAVAISFIYLRCPLPTYCPLLNQKFQDAQSLVERLGANERMRLLSITIDPASDTPELLAKCASDYEAHAPLWTFAGADEDDLRKLGDSVGLEFQKRNGQITHNLRAVVVDPSGRLRRILPGNTWTPQELVAELRGASTVSAPTAK